MAFGWAPGKAASTDQVRERAIRAGIPSLPNRRNAQGCLAPVLCAAKPLRTIPRAEAPVWSPKVNTEHQWTPGEQKAPTERSREEEKPPAERESDSFPKADEPIPIPRTVLPEKSDANPKADFSNGGSSGSPNSDSAESESKSAPTGATMDGSPLKPDLQKNQHRAASISLAIAGYSVAGYFGWLLWSRLRSKRKAVLTPQAQAGDDIW